MDKFKFYLLKIHLDLDDIPKLLTSNNDEFYGIQLINQEPSCLKFNFYERKLLETTYIDKNFNEHTIEQLKSDSFSFYIYNIKNVMFLKLQNPSRNISFFKNVISQKLLNKITIENISINPLDLFKYLESIDDNNFVVSTIEIKDIQLTSLTVANLTIKSTENLPSIYQKYIQSDKYLISKTVYSSNHKFKGNLLLTNECNLNLKLHQQEEFLNIFINFLFNYIKLRNN